MNHSLQRQLNRRILTAMVLFALLASAISGWIAFNEARELQDNLLRQVASLVDTHSVSHGMLSRDDDPEDTLVLQVLGASSASSLPIPTALEDGLHTLHLNGMDWRVLVYTRKSHTGIPAASPADTADARLAVSQQTWVRDEVAWNNSLNTLLPVLLLMPILMAVVSLAIRQNLGVIRELAMAIDRRDESSLEKLPEASVPEEILPFVAAINRLLERLQRAISQQRRFVADAAHELRTPVAGLSLMADNLARTNTAPQIQQHLQPLQAGLARIQSLVAQLLDLARLQGENRSKPQPVDLQDTVQQVIAELFPLAERKAIDLGMVKNQSLQLLDLSGNLRILLHNAIENAIRYTPIGGRVDVSVFMERDCAVVLVDDTGPGIPVAELAEVFEPFYRVGVSSEPGNGLGLAISQEIARRLGGTITLTNRTEGGLCFRYTQPLSNMTARA